MAINKSNSAKQKITKADIETENEELKQTIRLLHINNSLTYTFLRGFVYGFATVVGGAVFLSVGIWILTSLQIIPYLGEIAALILTMLEKNN